MISDLSINEQTILTSRVLRAYKRRFGLTAPEPECHPLRVKSTEEVLRDDTKRDFIYDAVAKAPGLRQARQIPKILANPTAAKVISKSHSDNGEQAFKNAVAIVREQTPAA